MKTVIQIPKGNVNIEFNQIIQRQSVRYDNTHGWMMIRLEKETQKLEKFEMGAMR